MSFATHAALGGHFGPHPGSGEFDTIDPDVLVACAGVSLRAQALDDARVLLSAALGLDKDHPRAWAMLGVTLERLGEQEAAGEAYENAVARDVRDPHVILDLARFYVDVGADERARSLLSWLLVECTDAPLAREQALAILRLLEARR